MGDQERQEWMTDPTSGDSTVRRQGAAPDGQRHRTGHTATGPPAAMSE